MLGEGGDTDVCLMYADVGRYEQEILWCESTAHDSFVLM
jgi:hypothetical protein